MKMTEYKIFNRIGFAALLGLLTMSLVIVYSILSGYINSESNILMAILLIVIFASIGVVANTYATSIRSRT